MSPVALPTALEIMTFWYMTTGTVYYLNHRYVELKVNLYHICGEYVRHGGYFCPRVHGAMAGALLATMMATAWRVTRQKDTEKKPPIRSAPPLQPTVRHCSLPWR